MQETHPITAGKISKSGDSPYRLGNLINLLFRPSRFFTSDLALDSSANILVAALIYGVVRVFAQNGSDMFVRDGALAGNLMVLAYDLIALLGLGAIVGFVYLRIGGWWFGLRIILSGNRNPESRHLRAVMVYASLIWTLPYLLFGPLLRVNSAEQATTSFLVSVFGGIALLQLWSYYTSYRGVCQIFEVKRTWALFWFVFLPLMLNAALIGNTLADLWPL